MARNKAADVEVQEPVVTEQGEQAAADAEAAEHHAETAGGPHGDVEAVAEAQEAKAPRGVASYVDTSDVNALLGAFVDEGDIPAALPRGGGKHGPSDRYMKLCNAVKAAVEAAPQNAGRFIEVAKFATNQGANQIVKAIRDGKTLTPANEAFRFRTAKFERSDGKGRGSSLWIAYYGPGVLTDYVTAGELAAEATGQENAENADAAE